MSPVSRSIQREPPNFGNGSEDLNRNYYTTQNSDDDVNKYDLKVTVKLPDREDRNEWIAKNLFDFHKQVCCLYGTISEHCTADRCPEMTAGINKYLWSHGSKRQPLSMCAAQYIHHSLDWVQEQLDDEDIFPTRAVEEKTNSNQFPPDFELVAKTIAKRLFRVFAHVYHHHLTDVMCNKEEPHMNTSLKHFIYFIREFDLVTTDELSPLKDYIDKLDLMSLGNLKICY